ncbi:MAG: FAD-dependent oxidoreductase [Anaerolineales bacterium]
MVKGIGTKRYSSWGRYPAAAHKHVESIRWRHDLPDLQAFAESVLPFGYGRSYGDSCLNNGGILLDTTALNQFMAFDTENGLLCCEAGVSLAEILEIIVPHGWFLAVTPGSKYVSVAGAIANDVHGKNHHVDGTFGCHVTRLELLRSDGQRLICSPDENEDYFRATIGGLGLTGVILWAEFRLKRIPSPLIKADNIRFRNVDEFFEITEESEALGYPYTVSWVDCMATGDSLGRGHFQRGNFYDPPLGLDEEPQALPPLPVPVELPSFAINPLTVKLFNTLYYNRQPTRLVRSVGHYNKFFYPLDALVDWYRGYGKAGFFQYQFVLPYEDLAPVKTIFRRIANSGQGSPLVVFKVFGDMPSPGMLSFPRPGVTLAMDFPNKGRRTLELFDQLDEIVFAHGGALYPAKDARMSASAFRRSYPNWEAFAAYVDPKFSSTFWRRVTG